MKKIKENELYILEQIFWEKRGGTNWKCEIDPIEKATIKKYFKKFITKDNKLDYGKLNFDDCKDIYIQLLERDLAEITDKHYKLVNDLETLGRKYF